MASVLKRIQHNFKSSHFQSTDSSCGGKRSPTPSALPDGLKGSDEKDLRAEFGADCPIPNELLHRRKVSISKSGRYKENHKKRCALLDESKRGELNAQAKFMASSSSSSKEEQRTTTFAKDEPDALREEKNKENNERNKENIIARRDSIISDTDGHAVADEIESLAKTLTENGLETNL